MRIHHAAIVLILCSVLCGCTGASGSGEATGKVSGTLKLDGKPFSGGTINLYDGTKGASGQAQLSEDGQFKLEQPLPVGTYSVTVLPAEISAPTEGVKAASSKTGIPKKYRSDRTSDLKAVVTEGDNVLTLEMKSR